MLENIEHTPVQRNSPLHQELRTELEATRLGFHTLLATLTPDDWNTPSDNPAWTNGELLWHMTDYLFMMPQQLVWLQSHTFPDMTAFPADELNAANEQQTREEASDHTLESIARAYEEGHAVTLAALDTVQDHEWQFGVQMPDMGPTFSGEYRTVESLFRYHARHVAEHTAQIRRG